MEDALFMVRERALFPTLSIAGIDGVVNDKWPLNIACRVFH